jgi:hypothetical protein
MVLFNSELSVYMRVHVYMSSKFRFSVATSVLCMILFILICNPSYKFLHVLGSKPWINAVWSLYVYIPLNHTKSSFEISNWPWLT